MKQITMVAAACTALAVLAGMQVARAQARSVVEGVYTDEQAKRGAALYKEQCAACHGEDLIGNDIMPGLTGDTFAANWQGKSVGELYDRIQMTMPALAPGSLTPEQTADVIAYMLSVSKYPAGTHALASSVDALAQIKIDAPKK